MEVLDIPSCYFILLTPSSGGTLKQKKCCTHFILEKKVEDDIVQNSNEFDNLTSILRIVKINSGAREMDQRIKCLSGKDEDLSSNSQSPARIRHRTAHL